MTHRVPLLVVIGMALSLSPAFAQKGAGKSFGGRDPRTSDSRKAPAKGAISAEHAKQYVIADSEGVSESIASGKMLHLVTDVKVEVGKGRPFNMQDDSFDWAKDNGIDPAQTVYPIRGSYNSWTCSELGTITGDPGKNCTKLPQPAANGICFKSSSGDWHCTMTDFNASGGMERYPPPMGF